MKSITKISFDENISDEFLSEDVSSCKIPSSAKILENMSYKSMSTRKQTEEKFKFNPVETYSYLHLHKNLPQKLKDKKPRLNSYCEEIKSEAMSRPQDLCKSTEKQKQRHSLKQEISNLLKIAAEIRSNEKSKGKFTEQEYDEPLRKRREAPSQDNITMRDIPPSFK
ncbi:unnamed protein product [Moneuplotes crassus]|uniref:Uncharacterized protein n=1 Tax=Euplotes crassus TaxID=5936 RepID=A0AAD1U891_EUPCR|nr:unnamed protein product [Moneuplotes crassus]